MTHDDFNGFVSNFVNEAAAEVKRKNADYAGSSPSPFAAFDETAATLGLTREQVWAVFYMKHVRAVLRWVADGSLDSETIESRLLDLIAYPAILYAMINEEGDIPIEHSPSESDRYSHYPAS
ncbi:MAG: hypothetical protein OJJ55_19020 [Rhodococcus sp.]|nr:hypothetical protein [Rhodococcus sp. (in: high G+C Gram-positive bacteria)]